MSEIMTQACYAIQAVACPTTPTYLTCPTSSLIVVYSKTHMFMQFNDTKDLRKVDWAKKGKSSGQFVDFRTKADPLSGPDPIFWRKKSDDDNRFKSSYYTQVWMITEEYDSAPIQQCAS